MKLYHTSPEFINEVHEDGLFGSHIFFSTSVYCMCVGNPKVYEVEIDENEIIKASSMFYQENYKDCDHIVKEVMRKLEVTEQEARDLLDETICIHEIQEDFDGEKGYWLQKMTAKAAQALGFNAVAVTDETGESYMLDLKVYKEKMKLVA